MSLPAYPRARDILLAQVPVVTAERIAVRQALGRVLAEDLVVPRDFPDLPRSAVDGYAVQAGRGPAFRVVTEVPAGRVPERALGPGEAAAVMTGAVVPAGADCVARLEDCRLDGDRLQVDTPCAAGAFLNPAGSEARAGEPLGQAGSRIGAVQQAALICAGLAEVPVHRRVRLGIVATGDELQEVEESPRPGAVTNTNAALVAAVGAALGVECEVLPAVEDRTEAVITALDTLGPRCDHVITSGGVSVGRYDRVRQALDRSGSEVLLRGTDITPGRPLHLAAWRSRAGEGPLVFALPGYPAALLVNLMLYLVPAVKKAAGRRDHATRWLEVETKAPLRGRPDRQYLARVSLDLEDGRWRAGQADSQMASHFLNFARMNGLVRMPLAAQPEWIQPDGSYLLPAGSRVPALHFDLELT